MSIKYLERYSSTPGSKARGLEPGQWVDGQKIDVGVPQTPAQITYELYTNGTRSLVATPGSSQLPLSLTKQTLI